MNFTVEFSDSIKGQPVYSGAPEWDGDDLIIDGQRYTEEQWLTVTVISEKGQAPKKKSRGGLFTIPTTRGDA